ncbi:MAG: hypothetical protein ACKVX9_16615, partial [Blastocatellia bacterium]
RRWHDWEFDKFDFEEARRPRFSSAPPPPGKAGTPRPTWPYSRLHMRAPRLRDSESEEETEQTEITESTKPNNPGLRLFRYFRLFPSLFF